ncbi:MAG TPA: GNAT family N-acetyltransferase [Devosia sp.]|nr:GNAT family N-acetyltransferase [Devosia sp.]
MSAPKYLIDTNVFIPLEDAGVVPVEFAELLAVAARNGVGIFVHEAAFDDISRDKDVTRRTISLSKLRKFPQLAKVMGLSGATLAAAFGPLIKHNDVVDATLLHALQIGVADFVITEDRGLHGRVQKFAPQLVGRVLYVADALSLLRTAYEPATVSIPFVEEIDAHSIPLSDPLFNSLREGYAGFDTWWREKCIKKLRKCWIVVDNGELAGLVVRKEEKVGDTDARLSGTKILKICTFKVRAEKRGIKLGELLLKQALWFAQTNGFDLVYVTTFPSQGTLIELIEYYGFQSTYTNAAGELVYEKSLSREPLSKPEDNEYFTTARVNYPRFYAGPEVSAYCIPIKEAFHENLFPELASRRQPDLFELIGGPKTPGNTIRKVYLCRAQARIAQPGAILFFYKGKSRNPPGQAMTTVGVFEGMSLAHSGEELRQLAGGRSVYSDAQLRAFKATNDNPVKVINFLITNHIFPVIELSTLQRLTIFKNHPPQSIVGLTRSQFMALLSQIEGFGFRVLS